MKKISMLAVFMTILLLIGSGCGDNGPDYDKYGNDESKTDADSDTDSQKPDNDHATDADKTEDDADDETVSDADIAENDDETGDSENQDDGDPSDPNDDFWKTCEGIIVCSNNCKTDDITCKNKCYGAGSDEAQDSYRGWGQCFSENCEEDKTAECSAEKCAEWEDLCNVTEAFNYEFDIPAPYGNAAFAGEFSYILNNRFPSAEGEIVQKEFATGQISSQSLNPKAIVSFVRTSKDSQNNETLDVYQVPYNIATQVFSNPAVILRIKIASAVKGEHAVGVSEEKEAELIVADLDSKHKISCYHAFGIGTFTIDEADIQSGSSGKFKFSNGTAELFYPQNIPELGGDAREILGVTVCPLIY